MIRTNVKTPTNRKPNAGQAAVRTGKTYGSLAPSPGVLIVSLLAMAAVQLFRLGHSLSVPILVAEVLVFFALPWIAFGTLRYRFKSVSGFSFTETTILCFQSGAILIGLLVSLWHFVIRQFGFGDANEIVALVVLQSVGWYLAVFSKVPGFEKTNSILSGALVFFVCCIADDSKIFLIAGLFTFAGLWWLLGQYWSRLETRAIDGESRSLRLQGAAVSLTMLIMVLVACLAAAIPFAPRKMSLAGLSPFSGGENGGQDKFAISGIGDGDMLTAGDNATTTGAVDSGQFIESDKPTLYDITSERYEGPVKKKRRNRAVSLSGKTKHMHDAKQSEQAGRTFRTIREVKDTTDQKLEDRITEALFYVEGSVPARFSINNFCRFDGWDWSSVHSESESNESKSTKPRRIILSEQNGKPVFTIDRRISSYLTGRRTHRIKIMRLDSKTIPTSALFQRWHIPLVDKLDMFFWNKVGLIEMDGECIPSHTIIDVESHVPNYHLLRGGQSPQSGQSFCGLNRSPTDAENSDFLQVPETSSRPSIQGLANEWIAGIKPGWKQVESIVNHLRNDFALKPNWEADEQTDDSVSLFLEQGGGPSYMFATACAIALRSAGYKTRVASGFLVQKKDYVSVARQSIVTADNLHMWPEVCLDGEFWVPVEPTPGYPIPYSTQTALQWITAKVSMAWGWILANPVSVALFVGFVSLAFVFRAQWITSLAFGWWLIVRTFWPQRLLKTTRQLIDLRFWFAGDRRPGSQTIDVWYARVESNALSAFFNLWNAQNYSEHTASLPSQDLVLACRGAISSLSLNRIKRFRNANFTHPSK